MTCTSEGADETQWMQLLLSEVDSCCLGKQSCNSSGRQLYRNTLKTDFARAFLNDHNDISDAVEQDPSAG